jgi:puromycin-sensitive aminopeptidase
LFGLEVATKALPFYKDYFNIAYPLPKMDLIAIADFAGGAMENWGLVTYRETCLLVDTQNTSSNRKQWIALVVAHELAHQWFGNLVTMEWWTHLWLNEGFASFIEYLCVDHLFPEYQIWTQFVADTYMPALDLDALHNSHPIEVPVGHPSEIDEIFDSISYNKGAAVIRMLHRFIGDELFRKGMNSYLSRHSYKNTMTEDLWAALEEASSKPVGAVMSTWTKQKGFPVISVSSRNDGNTRILTLTQEKFCADGKVPESEQNVLWMIPISVSKASSAGKIAAEALMETKTLELVVPNVGSDEWIKLNPSAVGLYRV